MTTTTSPNTIVEANEPELLAMARMLRRGTGTFVLAFARLNVPALRTQLVATLRDVLTPFAVTINAVTLSGKDADIHAELAAALGPGHPLFVYGLESVMPSADPYRALGQLNERRGRYQSLARPVVFWVPEYVLRLIATRAPDFWAWRSGVYEFAADKTTVGEIYTREMAEPFHAMTSLTYAEKEARIRLLTALLDDYQGDDAVTSSARSGVQYKLGRIYEELGEYAQAEQLYRQSLTAFEALGDRREVAATQNALADLYRVRGDYAQAEQLYRQSLATKEALGDRREVAVTQNTLADLYRVRGDYAQAEPLYRQSLATTEALRDRRGVAVTQNALAGLYRVRGDYAQAEQLYRQSLATDEALGDRHGVAVTLYNLALLCAEQERLAEAVGLLTTSRDLFRQLGLEKDASDADAALATLSAKSEPDRSA